MTHIHRVYDSFPVEKALWKPFYKNDVKCSSDVIRVSCFESESRILAVISNIKNIPSGIVKAEFPFEVKSVSDSISGEKIDFADNAIIVSFEKFDYLLLNVESR